MKNMLIVYCGAPAGFLPTQHVYEPVFNALSIQPRWIVEEALALCDIHSLRESVDTVLVTSGVAAVPLYTSKPHTDEERASDVRAQLLIQFVARVLDEGVPLWGVARGQSAIAAALGGLVEDHSERAEAGNIEVHRLAPAKGDLLFDDAPETFTAVAYRVDDIMQLPVLIVPLANSRLAQFHALKVAGKPVYGSAFDPLLSDRGRVMFERWLNQSLKPLSTHNV